jgi:hypothetical protein
MGSELLCHFELKHRLSLLDLRSVCLQWIWSRHCYSALPRGPRHSPSLRPLRPLCGPTSSSLRISTFQRLFCRPGPSQPTCRHRRQVVSAPGFLALFGEYWCCAAVEQQHSDRVFEKDWSWSPTEDLASGGRSGQAEPRLGPGRCEALRSRPGPTTTLSVRVNGPAGTTAAVSAPARRLDAGAPLVGTLAIGVTKKGQEGQEGQDTTS